MRDEPDPPSVDAAAAERLRRAARAAQQLSDVLWESLHDQLGDPDPERVKHLSERLAEVSSTIATLAALPASHTSQPPPVAAQQSFESLAPQSPPFAAPTRSEPAAPRPQTPTDEQVPTQPVDEHNTAPTAIPLTPEIEIRDARREEGPSAWVSSVGRLLQRHSEDGLPFGVLLVEIVDVARLERSSTPHDMHGLVAQVEDALGRGMRASDHLSRETLGRYWLVAPETNGTGARMLAERLARLVRTSASHRGVPLEVAIGIAVCPDDGTEAPALAARADLGVYSARATGRSVAHTDPPGR